MLRRLVLLVLALAWIAPSMARADPPPVEDYGKLPAMDLVRLSPSGDRYAFVADDGQARRLYVSTIDNQPLQIASLGSRKVWDIRWAGEDFVLIQTSTTVGDAQFTVTKMELTSVIVLNLRTHKFQQVFANSQSVDPVVLGNYGTAQINGRWYGYFGGFSLTSDDVGLKRQTNVQGGALVPDLYQVDLETGALTQVATGESTRSGWLIGPTGAVVARLNYYSRTGKWVVMTGKAAGRTLASGRSTASGSEPNRRRDFDQTHRR
jgi:hypothetical protein